MLVESRRRTVLPSRRLPHRSVGSRAARADHARARRPRATRQHGVSVCRRRARRCLRAASGLTSRSSRCPTAEHCTLGAHARQLPPRRPHPRLGADPHRGRGRRLGGHRRLQARGRSDVRRRSSRCPATRSSPRARSACPIYRWDPTAAVIAELVAWWHGNAREALASVVFCYTLGKAQRLLAELARVDRRAGVRARDDAADDRGLPRGRRRDARRRSRSSTGRAARRSRASWCWRRCRRAARRGCGGSASSRTRSSSGLMRVRGVRRQRAYDRGFVLSDHADWPALLDDDRRNRRQPRAGDARPCRAAGALPARAGPRRGRDAHGVGRRSRRRIASR